MAATCLVFPAAADCEHDFVDNICKYCHQSYCDINGHDYINNDDQESCTVCGVKRCANGDHVYDSGGNCLYCTNYNESYDVLPRYTVTFMDGTTTLSTSTVKIGNCVEKPADPEKANFKFDGWFEEGETTAFDFDTPISADTTLYAHFTIPEISYIGADGNTATTTDYNVIDENTTSWSGTMVVPEDTSVTINGQVDLTATTNLILCDGCELTISNVSAVSDGGYGIGADLGIFFDSDLDQYPNLSVYAQQGETGKLNVSADFTITAINTVSFYGGDINLSSGTFFRRKVNVKVNVNVTVIVFMLFPM